MTSRIKRSGFWILLIATLVVTPIALFLGIGSGGAGHGDYFWAKILFPYSMLSALLFQSITFPFIVLAIIQFPLYGLILALRTGRKSLASPAIGLGLVHILSAVLCLFLESENF